MHEGLRTALGDGERPARTKSQGSRLVLGVCGLAVLSLVLSGVLARPSDERDSLVLTQSGYGYDNGDDSLELSKTTVEAGDSVKVSSAGFEEKTTVEIWLSSTPRRIGSTKSDADGAFATTVEIPNSTEPGKHTISAIGIAPDGTARELSRSITVTKASGSGDGGSGDPSDSGGQQGARLPTTGHSILLMVAFGLFLTALGMTLRGRVRQRADQRLSAESR